MSFLNNLQSDLRRAQVEHEAALLVQVLRQRLRELTFSDLRQILNSRMGEGLAARRVSELIVDGNAAPTEAPPPKPHDTADTRSARPKKKAKTKAKTKAKPTPKPSTNPAKRGPRRKGAAPKSQASAGAPAKPPKVSALTVAGRERYDAAVIQFLRERGGWHASGFVRAHAGGSEMQIRGAMERLEKAGLIERTGKFASTRYQARA